ncbi:hypothetical protein [Catenulispora pinisilvae]|uniref:hypothetical protein n=1 Tax=Catenulispora pinisilvae TaxID=2705253 RepID=UPI0018924254|nr:hypothetical protein [Catenulispora pinisilvae]
MVWLDRRVDALPGLLGRRLGPTTAMWALVVHGLAFPHLDGSSTPPPRTPAESSRASGTTPGGSPS